MQKRSFLPGVLLLSLVFALTAAAQQGERKDEELQKLVERIDVHVINVDVIVTDKKGNRITGLTKDDFEIVENNVPQPVTNFFEAAPPALSEKMPIEVRPSAEQSRRRLIVFIDQLSLDPQNRNRVFKHIRKLVSEAVRENDEVMIASYARELHIRLPFTDNLKAVEKTLNDIEKEPASGIDLLHDRRDTELQLKRAELPLQRLLIARTYTINAEQRMHGTVEALMHLMSTVAGVEGKKALIMISESLPMQPGREILAMLDKLEHRADPFAVQAIELGRDEEQIDTGTASLPDKFSSIYDSAANSRLLIEELAKIANANGITVYPIHAGGIAGGRDTLAEYSGDAGGEMLGLAEDTLTNSADAMRYIADYTGGTAVVGSFSAIEPGLESIRNDLTSYYSLGYRAGDERPGDVRRVKVRVKNPAYVVRTRRELIDKSPTQTMSDHALANLLAVQKANDLGIVLSVDNPVPEGRGKYRVPIRVQIPMKTLTLIPRGDMHLGGFEVFAVLGNDKNAVSKVVRLPHRLTFDQGQFDKVKDTFYTYRMDVMMHGGDNQLSVAVVDQVSGTQGYGRAMVAARQ